MSRTLWRPGTVRFVTRVQESWARVSSWLRDNAPASFGALSAPASPDQVGAAQALLDKVELPSDYVELLSLVNGPWTTIDPAPGDALRVAEPVPGYFLMRIQDVPEQVTMLNDLFAEPDPDPELWGWWSTSWVPFATNAQGDFLVVDAGPGDTAGAVIEFVHDEFDRLVMAPSLSEYLDAVADALSSGGIIRHHYRPTVVEGALVWEIETPTPPANTTPP